MSIPSNTTDSIDQPAAGAPIVGNAVARLAGLNAVNILFGLVLNGLLAAQFGASGVKDALDASLSIPTQVIQSTGLASLGGTSIYVISRLDGVDEGSRRREFITAIGSLQTLYCLLVAAAYLLLHDVILAYFAKGFADAPRALLSRALYGTAVLLILRPLATFLGAVATGVLRFGALQVGTLIEKAITIGGVAFVMLWGPLGYPVGTVLGVVASVAYLGLFLRSHGLSPSASLRIRTPEIQQALRISLPWMATAPLLTATSWILVPLMLRMHPGSYAAYGYAILLNTTLTAVVLTPLTDWYAPLLSRASVRADRQSFEQSIVTATRLTIVAGTLLLVCSVGLAKPLVGTLLYRGAMQPAAARTVATLTAILGLGLIGRAVLIFCARLFQAQVATHRFLAIQVGEPVMTIGIATIFAAPYGVTAVVIAIAISANVNALIALVMIQRDLTTGMRVMDRKLATWCTAAIVLAVAIAIIPMDIRRGAVVNLAIGSMLFAVIYYALARLAAHLHVVELASLEAALKKPLKALTMRRI